MCPIPSSRRLWRAVALAALVGSAITAAAEPEAPAAEQDVEVAQVEAATAGTARPAETTTTRPAPLEALPSADAASDDFVDQYPQLSLWLAAFVLLALPLLVGRLATRYLGLWLGALAVGLLWGGIFALFAEEIGVIFGCLAAGLALLSRTGPLPFLLGRDRWGRTRLP